MDVGFIILSPAIVLAAMLARRQRNMAPVGGCVLIGVAMATMLIFGLLL